MLMKMKSYVPSGMRELNEIGHVIHQVLPSLAVTTCFLISINLFHLIFFLLSLPRN